jgi:hypothetical protein
MAELCVMSQCRAKPPGLRIIAKFLVCVSHINFAYSTEYLFVSSSITVPYYYIRSLVVTAVVFILFVRIVNKHVENVVKMRMQHFNGEGQRY